LKSAVVVHPDINVRARSPRQCSVTDIGIITLPLEEGATRSDLWEHVRPISGRLMSVPPHPFFQPRFVLDTACEDLKQHLPCTSDVLPQVSGEYTASFDQPVPVSDFAVDNPYSVVPQPVKSCPTPPQLEDAAY
ncbi:hypothetical protein ABHI18_006159, partial [Aspergillus niger]